jgi:putative heme-binding domain-containing protein
MKAGVYVRGFCNPWGHHFDPWGQSFVTDGAGYQGLSLAVPGAMYFTYAGAPRIIDSISPGSYPKFCGLELIQSPLFPADWQGDAITCDFRAHKIVRFSMEERDSAFLTTQQPDLVTTDDVTFRPIDVKFGPDGALYIADWSNPIIQHGEVDFRDPRRDHVNGRIWRVVPKGVHAPRAPRLTTRTNRELLDGLNSPAGFVRENSRRVLLERGSAILPDLQDWVTSSRDDRSHLEALWLYQGLNLTEPQLLSSLINSDDHRIRAAAVRAVHHWKRELPSSFQWKQALSDSHPRVRMEALRALAVDGTAADMEDALSVLDHPMDKYLEYALWLTVNDLRDPWVTAVEDGAVNPSGLNPDKLAYALKALPPDYAGRVLGRALAGADIPADGSGPWLDIIGQAGTPAEIEKVSAGLSSGKFDEQGIVAAIRSLDEAARSRRLRPSNTQGRLTAFLQSRSPGIRAAAITLAGAWKDIGADFAVLARIPTDTDHPAQERLAAVEALRQIGGAGSIRALEKAAAASDSYPEVRLAAATALATLDTETAWPVVSGLMKTDLSDAQILGLWRSLLQVKGAGGKLEPWVRVASIPARAAELGVRAAGEGGRQLPGLVIALNQAGQLEGRARLSPEDFEFLARQVRENGDPHRGETIYRRSELACTTCHAIGGIGGVLGPDMTSIGASAPLDYLIESLYFPNAKIKEGYHAVNIDTIAELTYSGTLVREDASRIWLRDAASNIVEVPKDQIVSRVTADYSLMPSGLIRNLGTRDQVDLFAFLSSLGKAGDFDASRPDKARRWFLYPATIDAAQFGEEKILSTDLGDNASWRGGWKSFDSLVNGQLPKSSLQQRLNEVASRFPNKLYAGALFEAAGQGTVEFSLSGFSHPEAAAWIDGKEVPLRDNGRTLSVSLQPGRHTIILRLPADELPDSITLGSPQVTFVTR